MTDQPTPAEDAATAQFIKGMFAPFPNTDTTDDTKPTTHESKPDTTDVHLAALRSKVAERYGMTAEDAALFLLDTDEEAMDTRAKQMIERFPHLSNRPSPSLGNIAPREGATTERGSNHNRDERTFVRDLLGNSET